MANETEEKEIIVPEEVVATEVIVAAVKEAPVSPNFGNRDGRDRRKN